jgi:hypothetical protein
MICKLSGRSLSCLAVCLSLLVGCGESQIALTPVAGVVTYKGQPLAEAQLTFMSADEKQNVPIGSATTNDKGEFKANVNGREGLAPGEYVVGVIKTKSSGQQVDLSSPSSAEEAQRKMMEAIKQRQTPSDADKSSGGPGPGQRKSVDTSDSLIPVKYNNPAQSTLKASIKKGAAENLSLKFDLND